VVSAHERVERIAVRVNGEHQARAPAGRERFSNVRWIIASDRRLHAMPVGRMKKAGKKATRKQGSKEDRNGLWGDLIGDCPLLSITAR